jgi:hypothetical protein
VARSVVVEGRMEGGGLRRSGRRDSRWARRGLRCVARGPRSSARLVGGWSSSWRGNGGDGAIPGRETGARAYAAMAEMGRKTRENVGESREQKWGRRKRNRCIAGTGRSCETRQATCAGERDGLSRNESKRGVCGGAMGDDVDGGMRGGLGGCCFVCRG